MSRRVVLYCRVSSIDQAERGFSLPSQLEACRKYADQLELAVVAEITDDISGATPFTERPGGRQVQNLLDLREADAVMVHQVDRLSRDLVDTLVTVRDWLQADVGIFAGDVGWIKSENDIVLVIKGWQGSDERKKIRERTMRGRYTKARTGKVVGGGKPPYGYRYADGQFEIVESEAQVVRMIYEWYMSGKDGGPPLVDFAIARELSKMGLPTPGERSSSALRQRAPGMWSDNAVHRILTSETYAGVWWYGRRIGHDGKGGKRPKKDQVPVPVPPIVSRELWAAAQEKRKYNKRMSRRNCKREYLLRGRIKCECGYSMHGKWEYTGRPKYYYRSGEGRHRHTGLEEKKCDRLVRGDLLDTLVWEFVLDVMTDRERFEQGLIDAQEAERDALRPKRERLALVEEMIDNCGKEAEKLVQALKNVSGGIVEAALQRDIDGVNQQYEALVRERDELLESLEAEELSDEDIAAALAFREAVLAGMQNPTFEDKRRTLEDLRVQVKLFDRERAEVTCRIPRASTVITLVTSKDVKLPLTAELGLRYNASVCRR